MNLVRKYRFLRTGAFTREKISDEISLNELMLSHVKSIIKLIVVYNIVVIVGMIAIIYYGKFNAGPLTSMPLTWFSFYMLKAKKLKLEEEICLLKGQRNLYDGAD